MKIQKKTTDELVAERANAHGKDAKRTPISIVADNIRSLDNIGLLFRLCDLSLAEKLYLTGYTGHPQVEDDTRDTDLIARHNRRIEKTAVYAVDHQPWEYLEDAVPLVEGLKESGQTIIALEQTHQSVPYNQLPVANLKLPITLLVGHERRGVRQELLDLADHVVDIPILGRGNSHNVAIATSIVLYHLLEKTGEI